MRITENMRFNAMVGNLFSNLALNNDLTEKIASQKKVNRASDDPLSATKIVTIRQSKVAIEQYTEKYRFMRNMAFRNGIDAVRRL